MFADLSTMDIALYDVPGVDPSQVPAGQVSVEAGRAVLDCLGQALDGCRAGRFDGLCFTPFNKQAMHLGGLARTIGQRGAVRRP